MPEEDPLLRRGFQVRISQSRRGRIAFKYVYGSTIDENEIILKNKHNSEHNNDMNNFFAVQNLKMALKKANILQHTKSFFV